MKITYVNLGTNEKIVEEISLSTLDQEAKLNLFTRYEELLNKSLRTPFVLKPEEQEEYNLLYDELELQEGENLYNLMKMKYEFVR